MVSYRKVAATMNTQGNGKIQDGRLDNKFVLLFYPS